MLRHLPAQVAEGAYAFISWVSFEKLARGKTLQCLMGTFILVFIAQSGFAQLTGTKSIPGDYATLALAISDLNTQGVGAGGVTLDLLPGNPQTATSPGYTITTLSGTAANQIIITGNGNTITAAAAPPVGQRYDAIFNIIGGDYITIQNFVLTENPANTTGGALAVQQMTEFGVALYAASATDGAQNNTIQNNTITLSSATAYQNAIGIFSTSASSSTNGMQSASSIAGTNSNNKFYGNTISGVASGIYFISPAQTATVFESGNDVGGTSGSTGNNITFGISNTAGDLGFTSYSGATAAGIYFRNVVGNSTRFNTINSTATLTLPCGGVFSANGSAPTGITYTTTISNNTITLTNVGTTAMTGIDFGSGLSTGAIIGSNNSVTLNQTASAAVSAAIIGIKANYSSASNTANANTVVINQSNSVGATTSPVTGITCAGAPVTSINVTNSPNITIKQSISGTGSFGSGAITYIDVNGVTTNTAVICNVTGNTLNTTGSTIRSTGAMVGVNQNTTIGLFNCKSNTCNIDRIAASGAVSFTLTSGTPSEVADTVSNNNITFTGLSGTSSVTAISSGGGPTTPVVNNKSICNNTINITGTHSGTSIGITASFTNTGIFRNNSITISCASSTVTGFTTSSTSAQISGTTLSLTSSAASPTLMTGVVASSTTGAHSISTTTFTTMTFNAVFSASPTVTGISIAGGTASNVFNNTVTNLVVGGAASTGSPIVDGILVSGGVSVNVFRNKIYGLESNCTGATGVVNGIRISGGGTTGNTYYNNLIGNLSASASANPDAIRGISITATAATTTHNVYYNTLYLNASSSGANFGSSGIFHTTSATATTAALNLRNNIIVNASAAMGSGVTAAYRRSSTTLTNYASTSNNNLFFAGPTSAPNFIFFDGTAGIQMAAYKALVAPRDAGSVTETVSSSPGVFFQSFTGSSSTFLHIVGGLTTQAESGAVNIASYTDDYDSEVRQGNGGYAGSGTAPDIGADEFAGVAADLIGPTITYTPLANTICLDNPALSATITDASGVNSLPLTKPRIWFKKKTNANSLPGTNDNTTNGWKYAEATNALSPFNFIIDYMQVFGGVAGGDTIQYFVVAQDNASTPNLGINSGTFAAPPPTVALNGGAFPVTGVINSYRIGVSIPTTVTIGASGASYTTLSGTGGLFSAINAGGLSGNTVVTILDATLPETGAVALNSMAYACGSGPYTLTIKPGSTVTTVLAGSSATPLIDINGADNVTFDGSNAGTTSKDMTIRNTGAGPAFRLINDATGNTIKNTIVESQNASTTSGTIFFSTSTGTLGNSNNTINNCDVRDRSDAAGVPANAVYSSGSVGALNGSNTVSGCNVFNWTNAGVLVETTGAGNGWTINPSHFYQTASRTTALKVISILGGSGHSILSNTIGGSAPDRSGSPMSTTSTFSGITLTVGTTSTTNVQGNTMSNLNISGGSSQTFKGINITAGNVNVGTTSGNILGGNAAVYDTIRTNYDSDLIENSGAGVVSIENNTIGNAAYYNAGGDRLFGIRGMAGTISIKNNIIRDLKSNGSSSGFSFFPGGIWLATTVAGANVEGNQVYNIAHSNAATSAYTIAGIYVASVSSTGTPTTLVKNKIYNLTAAGTGTGTSSPRIWGIYVASGSATYANNMIAVGSTVSNESRIHGIEDLGTGTNNYYFNSVSLTGTTGSGSNSSYAFRRSGTATVSILDNIFSNARTGGTGFHVSIANTNAAATGWAASASNYNALNNNTSAHLAQWLGTAAGNNRDLTGWQAPQGAGTPGSGGDLNSINVAPVFTAINDLHLTPANGSLDNLGTPAGGITIDIDNDMRNAVTPDMGADEFMAAPCSSAVGGTASITGPSSFCTSGTPVISASGYSTGTGSGYQWMYSTLIGDYPASGSPVMGQTNPATLSTGVVLTTTYFWLRVTCSTGMSTDNSNMLTVTILPPPTAILSPTGTVNICPPTTDQLLTSTTNASSPTYVWKKDGVVIGGETNPTYTVTTTGGYTVFITDGATMCSNTSAISLVTFGVTPVQPVVTPSSVVMCGTDPAVLLTASGSSDVGSQTVTSGAISIAIPDFTATGISHSLAVAGIPGGATIDSVIVTFNITHGFDEDIIVNLEAPNGQIVNLVKGTIISSGTNFTNTRASSDTGKPAFPTTGAPFTSTYRADLATTGFQLTPSPAPTTGTFSSLFTVPNGTWKIRVVDDESIGTGSLTGWTIKVNYTSPANYTWSPNGMGSGLFTDAGATSAYTGAVSPTVYAKPSSTATYTVTATNGTGCTNTQTVMVTVNPTPTITLGANPSVCSGITMANLTYSATTESPDQYSINYNAGAETQGFVDVTNASLSGSPIVLAVPGGAVPATYSATLTVRNSTSGCVSSSYAITVTILPLPNAGTVSGISPLCVGATDTYLATGDIGGTWSSSNPAKASVNAMSGLVTALAGGTTYIKYTVSNACGSPDADSLLLTIDSIVVANNNDVGAGSLRDIIDCAPSGSTITFAPAMAGQTIVLLTGEIVINKNLTIIGPGVTSLTLSGNNATRIFHLLSGYTLTLQDMGLKNATAMTNGGAIYVEGNLNLNNVLLQNNFEDGSPKSLTVTAIANIDVTGMVDLKN